MEQPPDLKHDFDNLITSQQTLVFTTVSSEGLPELSVAPFIMDQNGCFYVLLSELASHTKNLLANPNLSILFAEPETTAKNLFARERAIISCKASIIDNKSSLHTELIQTLTQKFGATVTLLNALPDFHLFALTPISARYIIGFGQAFQVDLTHKQFTKINRSNN